MIEAPLDNYDIHIETLIIGAGACGMIAALSAYEEGQDVLIIEADPVPSGSTAISAGLIPAAGTKLQKNAGINDNPEIFANDIRKKAKQENDFELERVLSEGSAKVIEWLIEQHDLPFSLVEDFDYPGHSERRMHGLPSRSGVELINSLRSRIEQLEIPLICQRRADALYALDKTVFGARLRLPDGTFETVSADRVILACNGFGGNRTMVSKHMPEIDRGLWFGHSGNQGDAVIWGQGLGASTKHLSAYQGHGNVAFPHGILITWAVIMQGGFQVNIAGQRFWNEAQGYSEAARAVLSQPEGIAWTIFDSKIAKIARQFSDFKDAEAQGAIVSASTTEELETKCNLPSGSLESNILDIPYGGTDRFGREWANAKLMPSFHAVKVTGALFHTQGGLDIDPATALVRHTSGGCFQNLHAAGGAACGVSGAGDSGYLSGNGLLSASVLGFIAGKSKTTAS